MSLPINLAIVTLFSFICLVSGQCNDSGECNNGGTCKDGNCECVALFTGTRCGTAVYESNLMKADIEGLLKAKFNSIRYKFRGLKSDGRLSRNNQIIDYEVFFDITTCQENPCKNEITAKYNCEVEVNTGTKPFSGEIKSCKQVNDV